MYFLAIILPPVAVLLAGKPFQALLNLLLTALFWIPGAIHAVAIVQDKKATRRLKRHYQARAKAYREYK